MSYNKINNLVGWFVCLIACGVYLITKEATVSFWDCGEFISGAAKLEVVHSPGAPLFLMINRIFVAIFGMQNAALAVNASSALCSGFTILFLFWTITHFAKRIIAKQNEELTNTNLIKIMGAGIVGALAYTFSDTFWFSAVEGEVYAMSSFLTALVFWAILKWEDRLTVANETHADRWVVFIFFVMGLSIGVHLLNLLTIPAIVMVYYFKRYKVSTMGTVWAFLLGCIITGVVQYGVIQAVPILATKMDILFVNSFGLPFNSGVLFTILIIAAACFVLLRWSKKMGYYFVHLGTLCLIFVLVGYSAFFQTIIRSNADVPLDMTNPDNAISLIKYLQREQYGSVPLISGPDFNSQPTGMEDGKMQYWKGEKNYEELGEKSSGYTYNSEDKRLFPRIWDANDPNHVEYYKKYLGLAEGEKASSADNLNFFVNYQVKQMWWRYFCWNYIGRQNDIQNLQGEPQNGNWLSGIKAIDKMWMGDTDKLPIGVRDSRARNELYFLPFILGLLGLIYHYRNDKRNAFIVGLLFFFTGLAIVIYLNNTPLQPRERDYAYAGATYAFAIWIGLGVMMVSDLFKKLKLGNMSPIAASALCLLAVPMLMASKEWDDHDRSQKTLAKATAINYLESCEPNAILFTEGDNDTYPLWYAQEVEGIRNDVRIVNISLLGIDWYIDQLSRAINKAAPVPLIWKSEQYRGQKRDYIQYLDNQSIPQDKYVNLTEVLNFVGSDASGSTMPLRNGGNANYFPVKNFFLPVDKDLVAKNKILPEGDTSVVVDQVQFTMPRDVAYKNDLAILNILAANAWKRPIYFANSIDPDHYEGLEEYLQLEGWAYKLIPVRTPGSRVVSPLRVNVNKCVDLYLNKFQFGNCDKGIYLDQTNRRMASTNRRFASMTADALSRDGKKAEALKILDKVYAGISEKSLPYIISQDNENIGNMYMCMAYINAGDSVKSNAMIDKFIRQTESDIVYMNTLPNPSAGASAAQFDLTVLQNIAASAQQVANRKDVYDKIMPIIQKLAMQVPR
ncbi:MAG: DUF2723 domain-containing protein [Bacteroidetes bacterium]|nr:DUF2723 domain-containing protein [Bacteroidota bacterium]